MSKTTVSDLVQGLEKHLGVQLLQRTTRRVTVTADGAAFYERSAHILADLDEAEASVMQSRVAPKGRLRVDMPGALARLFIIPQLPPFLARYPDLRLELGMGLRPVHLLEEGIDCVVRVGMQAGLEPGRTTSRYDELRLLCEPCVPAGAWNPAQARGPVRPPMRQLPFKSHRTSHRLGILARRSRRFSSHSMASSR